MSRPNDESRAWYRLTREEQAEFHAAGYTRVWGAGAIIAPQGGPARSMYVILRGWVKITVTNDRGENAPIAARGPGEILGELATLPGITRTAAIEAVDPVQALVIPSPRARALLQRHPHIAEELLRSAALRLQQSDRLRLEAGGPDFAHRLAAVLVELAHQCAPDSAANTPVNLPFGQDELAGFARVSRSTLIRGLDELRKLHLIETARRRTTIPHLQPLRDYATGRANN